MKVIEIKVDPEVTDPKKLQKIQKLENRIGKELSKSYTNSSPNPPTIEEQIDIISGVIENMGFKAHSVYSVDPSNEPIFYFTADTLKGTITVRI